MKISWKIFILIFISIIIAGATWVRAFKNDERIKINLSILQSVDSREICKDHLTWDLFESNSLGFVCLNTTSNHSAPLMIDSQRHTVTGLSPYKYCSNNFNKSQIRNFSLNADTSYCQEMPDTTGIIDDFHCYDSMQIELDKWIDSGSSCNSIEKIAYDALSCNFNGKKRTSEFLNRMIKYRCSTKNAQGIEFDLLNRGDTQNSLLAQKIRVNRSRKTTK